MKMKCLDKGLVIVTPALATLPLSVLADMAPMSREEWESMRQIHRLLAGQIPVDMPSTSVAGCVLAALIGVFLSVCVFALVKRCLYSGIAWRKFVSRRMEWVVLTALILAGCLCVEVLFCPCSTFLSMVNGKTFGHDVLSHPHCETYEEYLFYERHCRKCGTALSYDKGRYCPKCNPHRGNSWIHAEKSADPFGN